MSKTVRWFFGIAVVAVVASCSGPDITVPDPGDNEPVDPKTSLAQLTLGELA